MQKVKVKDQSVQKTENIQTDRRIETIALPNSLMQAVITMNLFTTMAYCNTIEECTGMNMLQLIL